jgi:chloride channel 7
MHALVGATAMLGGVFRTSISLVVIMIEGTGGIEFLLPVILAIVLSNWVAHHIHSAGAYESDLERIGEVHFLQSEPSQKLRMITAGRIMASNVICFKEISSVSEVAAVLRDTSHNGFPVVRHTDGDGSDGQLVGIILRSQVLLLLEQRAIFEADEATLDRPTRFGVGLRLPRLTGEQLYLDRLMRVYHHTHYPHRRFLSSRSEAVSELEIDDLLQEFAMRGVNGSSSTGEDHEKLEDVDEASHAGKELAVDFRPWMNRAPLTVRAETSARRVYIIFRTLGLRHLCVTDASNRVIGMITRKDIAKAHKELELETDTPRDPEFENNQSFGMRSFSFRRSFRERSPRDVLYSLP